MLSLPNDVLDLQAGSSYMPLVEVRVGTTVFRTDDPTSGLRFVETMEGGQSFRATIEVHPSNLAVMHPGVLQAARGDEVTIKWGYVGSDSMVESPPLWVVSDSGLSEPGIGRLTYNCVGWWELLAGSRTISDPSDADAHPPIWPRDTTVRGILNELLQGRASVFLDSDDGIINVYRPYYEVDGLPSVLTTIRNLLDMTLSYIRIRDNGFHIVYPAASDPITWTYELDGHQFFTRSHTAKISIPNRMVVVPELPTVDSTPDFVGVALDSDSIDKIGYMDMITLEEGVLSAGEANSRASTLMARLKAENSDGIAIVPMNIGQELYDKVRLIDLRLGIESPMEHFVGMIRRVWTSNQYAMEMGLGGLMPHLSSLRTEHPIAAIPTYIAPVPAPPLEGVMTPIPPQPPTPWTPAPTEPTSPFPEGPMTPFPVGPMTPVPVIPGGLPPWAVQ